MKLFKSKKSECCKFVVSDIEKQSSNTRIKVLGSGCKKCNTLEANVLEALKIMKQEQSMGHISDFGEIASYGVMSTPALVIDNKVVSFGRVLSVEEIVKILEVEL